ncbi:NifU family protein [Campylobacter canadensis]|uniref:NifU family protein n=1 Tax=Campylobacter canadensis TaxID=449520 RepID=A0ABS7WSY1_9BACT|nr:NifU family protein [Campylobacter canadensis]MBZ7987080.1 NifU family protein [Campylobacter canadensis]MBZ7994694.1 NifU family protein [Campylobacter canadensis]MBZ7996190.1 NifU family protein [Campylobacter canadensis]MBZ7998116.1 NifU family protein [Campylobacter canadensis]MBZ7999994.1 NifU family protein [Campylobacter canadensis]
MIFSDEELYMPCKAVLDDCLHILHKDGGDLNFLGVKNQVVYIQLLGACNGCSAANITLKFSLEKALKEQISNELSIVNLTGGKEEFDAL